MKKISQLIKIFSFPALGLLVMPLSVQAATLDDVVDSVDNLRSGIVDWLNAAKDLYLEQMFAESASFPVTISANTAEETMAKAIKAKTEELATPAFREMLTQAEVDKSARLLATIPASDTFQKAPTGGQTFPIGGGVPEKKSSLSEGDAYLYAGTLLTPLVYDMGKEQGAQGASAAPGAQGSGQSQAKGPSAKAAFALIQFVTGLGQPTSELNISKLSERQREQIEAAEIGRNYKLYMRSVAAARSFAIDNLLTMYAKRISVPGLGEEAGMRDQKDASPAEVEHYIATRRVSDPEWFKSMAKAPPAMIERETLMVLVEIQRQLYESNRYQERAEALLSIIELQGIDANRAVQQEKEKAVKELLGIRN